MLPLDRYARLGATPDELAALQAEYDALPEAQQEIRLSQLASLSDGGLLEDLAVRRARAAEPAEVEPEPTPEPEPADEPEGLTLSDGSTLTD